MSPEERENLLKYAAKRSIERPTFLASALEIYRQYEQLDEAGLANYFGIPTTQLTRLALSRRPAPDSPTFRQDVTAIAQRYGFPPVKLANLLRRVTAYEEGGTTAPGFLMAARDREDEPEDEE